jgi:transposase
MAPLEAASQATQNGARRRRRAWTLEQKRQIVAATQAPGASISVVAQRHDVNANLLFTWRRQLAAATLANASKVAGFVPALIAPPAARSSSTMDTAAAGRMEIVLASGDRVIVDATVDMAALTRVIKTLSRR